MPRAQTIFKATFGVDMSKDITAVTNNRQNLNFRDMVKKSADIDADRVQEAVFIQMLNAAGTANTGKIIEVL